MLKRAQRLDAEGKSEDARLLLRRAAEAGDTRAMTALAQRLVGNAPFDIAEGLRLARAAACEGDAEAFHLLAVLAAEGLGVTQDWDAALDALAHAAGLGHGLAQGELALLAGNQAAGATRTHDWRDVRANIDLSRWLRPSAPQWKSTAPRIAIVEKFLDEAACDWLIARARPELRRATTYNPNPGAASHAHKRTNSGFGLETSRMDVITALMRARIAALTGLDVAGFEDASVLHYAVGEQYTAHFDFFVLVPAFAQEIALGGQRVLTFLIYLNDDFEGGETEFPALGWRHRGAKGDALFFWNVDAGGLPDRRTLHAGLAPVRGEKWLYSQWVRRRTG